MFTYIYYYTVRTGVKKIVRNCFETQAVPWGPLNLALVWRFCKLVEARYAFGSSWWRFKIHSLHCWRSDLTVLPCRRSYQILRWLISASSATVLMIRRRWNSVGTLWELCGNCVQVQLELAVIMSLNRTSRQYTWRKLSRFKQSEIIVSIVSNTFAVDPCSVSLHQPIPEIQWVVAHGGTMFWQNHIHLIPWQACRPRFCTLRNALRNAVYLTSTCYLDPYVRMHEPLGPTCCPRVT